MASVREFRSLCGTSVDVTTPSGVVRGVLTSITKSSAWLIHEDEDRIVPFADISQIVSVPGG